MPIYVDSAAGGANNGTSWTDAYTSILNAAVLNAASGSEIWVSHQHYQNVAGSAGLAFPSGTISAPIKLLSINKASDVLASGAHIETGSGGGRSIGIHGFVYVNGLHLTVDQNIYLNSDNSYREHFAIIENCTMDVVPFPFSGVSGRVAMGHFSSQSEGVVIVKDSIFDFRNGKASAGFQFYMGKNKLQNCTLIPFATQSVFAVNYAAENFYTDFECTDCDFSLAPNDFSNVKTSLFYGSIKHCSIPSGWLYPNTLAGSVDLPDYLLSIQSCNTGIIAVPAPGLSAIHQLRGSVFTNFNIYRTGGATDGWDNNRNYSWAMMSNNYCTELYSFISTPIIAKRIEAVSSPSNATSQNLLHSTKCGLRDTPSGLMVDALSSWNDSGITSLQSVNILLNSGNTATVYIGGSDVLNNDDFWLEASEPDQVGGYLLIQCFLAKPNTTIYIDPNIYIT